MNRNSSSQSGVALLMSLGILALLSILGVAFSTNMRLMERTTRDFVYEIQARYLAEGGIEYAIAELKEDARNSFVYDDNVVIEDQTGLLNGMGSIENVLIKDCASKLNINYASRELLDTVVDGVGDSTARGIVTLRNGPDGAPGIAGQDDDGDGVVDEADELGKEGSDDHPFLTPKSVNIIRDIYDDNKDIITVWGYCDPNTQDKDGNNTPRSAVNIHTAEPELIYKLAEAINGVTASDARTLVSLTNGERFNSWEDFKNRISSLGDANEIQNNFNPNRPKPDWDSGDASTEFCFQSGGRYEITTTGTIAKNDQILARKTITATIEIFDLWNQTTMEQFRGEDADFDGNLDSGEDRNGNNGLDIPNYERITWLDTCPVKSDDNWILTPAPDIDYNESTEYFTIPDSLKLGFWDDFEDEDYSTSNWERSPTTTLTIPGSYSLGTFDGRTCIIPDRFCVINLYNGNRWNFSEQYIHAYMYDAPEYWPNQAGQLFFGCVRNNTSRDYIFLHTFYANFDRILRPTDILYFWPIPRFGSGTSVPRRLGGWATFEVWALGNQTMGKESYGLTSRTKRSPASIVSQPGIVRLYSQHDDPFFKTRWDNIRVIGTEGEYASISFQPEDYAVDWGTMYSTVTIPESAEGDEGVKIQFQTSADSYGSAYDSPSSSIAGSNSIGISYKALLQTEAKSDYTPFETPVLEDVWITYLPKTKILYWREGVTEEVE